MKDTNKLFLIKHFSYSIVSEEKKEKLVQSVRMAEATAKDYRRDILVERVVYLGP